MRTRMDRWQITAPYDRDFRKRLTSMFCFASISLGLALPSAPLPTRSSRNLVVEPRALCARCLRPNSVCICDALPPAPLSLTRTRLLILQHPVEAKKRVATVPLIPLCVRDTVVVKGQSFSPDLEQLRSAVAAGYEPLLLYPGPGAVSLESWAANRTDASANALLVVVDGTWTQAHHMLRHSPELAAACTRVRFSDMTRSDFEPLRREPAGHCVSTLEACARSLRLLEPTETAALHLEASLRRMVAKQLSHVGRGTARFVDRKAKTVNRERFHSRPASAAPAAAAAASERQAESGRQRQPAPAPAGPTNPKTWAKRQRLGLEV